MHWFLLGVAVMFETIGTTALKASQGLTRPWPSALVLVAYAASFYLLARVLLYIPVGVAYAIWSGLGVVLIALIGWLVFAQRLDTPAVIGLGLIIAGIAVINVFSDNSLH